MEMTEVTLSADESGDGNDFRGGEKKKKKRSLKMKKKKKVFERKKTIFNFEYLSIKIF